MAKSVAKVVAKAVSKSEFKPRALEFLRHVEHTGEPLIITDRGRPVARIEPYAEGDEQLAVLRDLIVRYDDPLEPVGNEDWEELP